MILNDVSLITLLTSPYAAKVFIFIETTAKYSFLDYLLINEALQPFEIQELYVANICDLLEILHITSHPSQHLFYTNEQELITIIVHHSPEIMNAYNDFIEACLTNATIKFLTTVCANIFTDSIVSGFETTLTNFALFLIFYI